MQGLPEHVASITRVAVQLARSAPGTTGAALVGSWARAEGRPDSDVDIVLLTEQPEGLLRDDAWHRTFGAEVQLVRASDFGALQERRLRLASGLDVEVCIGRPSWAEAEPLDEGTRRVVEDGMHVLWDPSGRLAALAAAVTACDLKP